MLGGGLVALFALTGNVAVMRGIRRTLGAIAVLWFLFVAYRAFATGTQADPGMHQIMFVWPLCLYGFGWLLTFIAYGFRPKVIGRVVQNQAGAVFVAKPRRFWH